jgi:hypothetical protein
MEPSANRRLREPHVLAVRLEQRAGWINSLALGPPFFGSFDSSGGSLFTIPAGVPPGITVYAVTVDANMVLLVPISVTPPVTFTTC